MFLVVSSVLIVSALALFSGRIARTQFNQTMQELDNQVKTTINEVASGNYPTSPAFSCQPDATGIPVLTPAGSESQGTNSNCIFLGKVMQFGVSGTGGCSSTALKNCKTVNTYTMIGRRSLPAGTEVASLASSATGAYPRLAVNVAAPCTLVEGLVDLTRCTTLPGGAYVYSVKNKTTNLPIGALAITQSLASYSTSGAVSRLNSGSQVLQTWPVAGAFPRTPTQINTAVATSTTFNAANADPASGVVVCVQNGAQKGSITIGANDGRVSSTVFIGEDPACV